MEVYGAMAVRVSSCEGIHSVDAADPFERLFMAEYPRVVAIANRVLADAHEAEDVAQEVFVSFHRRHDPDVPYAAAWLHAAGAHTALNVVRSRQRRARREAAQAGASDRLRGHAERQLDPQCALEDGEQRREVRAALSRLPARSAAVLALRYSGLSYAEVAAALGVGVGQVGTMLRRAEAALRKEITNATPQ
jgi:RNA polymerase sigma-70 factor (ECF subfamily)